MDFVVEIFFKFMKLIYGGVCYLEQVFKNFDFVQFLQVWYGLEEWYIVLKNVFYFVCLLVLIMFVFSWFEGLYFMIGFIIYGWFVFGKDILFGSKWLSKVVVKKCLSWLLNKIYSVVLYYDGQLDDVCYCLVIVQIVVIKGVIVVNYVEIMGFEYDELGKFVVVLVIDLCIG